MENTTEQTTIAEALAVLLKAGEFSGRYKGLDNQGKPKADYLLKLIGMSDDQLYEEAKSKIWLSAYAANNPRSDYHFHCDATFDESERRGSDIYSRAYKAVAE
jgi:hypothetical protein